MNVDALWELYRQSLRKLHDLEQKYKAESDSGKEYACLTFNEMSTQYGVVTGINEAIQAASEDKPAAMRRAFDVFCEETGVPIVKGGKFGFWIPVEDDLPKPEEYVLVSSSDGLVAEAKFHKGDSKNLFLCGNAVLEIGRDVAAWMPLPEAYRAKDKMMESEEST